MLSFTASLTGGGALLWFGKLAEYDIPQVGDCAGHKPLAIARQFCQALRVALNTSRRNILPTAAALALLWFLPARARDWPQFRGPNRDAVWNETGLLKSFPADGLKVRWRQPVGRGWSSPVVALGQVFLTDSELQKPLAKERVRCFDEKTGKPLWTVASPVTYPEWAFIHENGGGPAATPIVGAGDAVFLFTDQGDLIRAQLTPQGYREISRTHLLSPTTPFGTRKFAWTPPAYANRHVFARNDEELICASLAAKP